IEIAEGDEVAVRIRNRGAVPAGLRETFFDKYTTAGKQGGTGLGTYSARLVAETQGGRISLEAEDDATTVIVRLPRHRRRAFLIADDDQWSRAAMRKMLEQSGAEIDE